jgi:hypothetical protein
MKIAGETLLVCFLFFFSAVNFCRRLDERKIQYDHKLYRLPHGFLNFSVPTVPVAVDAKNDTIAILNTMFNTEVDQTALQERIPPPRISQEVVLRGEQACRRRRNKAGDGSTPPRQRRSKKSSSVTFLPSDDPFIWPVAKATKRSSRNGTDRGLQSGVRSSSSSSSAREPSSSIQKKGEGGLGERALSRRAASAVPVPVIASPSAPLYSSLAESATLVRPKRKVRKNRSLSVTLDHSDTQF